MLQVGGTVVAGFDLCSANHNLTNGDKDICRDLFFHKVFLTNELPADQVIQSVYFTYHFFFAASAEAFECTLCIVMMSVPRDAGRTVHIEPESDPFAHEHDCCLNVT